MRWDPDWLIPMNEMCGCRMFGPGLSADAIRGSGSDYPRDPSDLCRCLVVSPNPPDHMRGKSPEWTVLVDHWDELTALLKSEHASGSEPKTYARMKELFAQTRSQS